MPFGWCMDGFHQGTTPKIGTVCPGRSGSLVCDCKCHARYAETKFPRKGSK